MYTLIHVVVVVFLDEFSLSLAITGVASFRVPVASTVSSVKIHRFLHTKKSIIKAGKCTNEKRKSFREVPLSECL